MTSHKDRLAAVKAEIEEVDPAVVQDARRPDDGWTIIDVREPDEWDNGHVPGAIHVPRGMLEFRIEGLIPDHDRPIVTYCGVGARSAYATKTLEELGYRNVESMAGGFAEWKNRGYRFDVPRGFSPEQRARYSRHLLLDEVGEKGQ